MGFCLSWETTALIAVASLGSLFLLKKRIGYFVWIVVTTGPRDLKSLIRLLRTKYFLYRLKRENGNVITVFRNHVKRTPDRVVFYYEDQQWTFRQLDEWTNRVANCFIGQGFKPGDEVAVFMESRPEFVGLWLGLAKAGVIAALINTNQRSQTLLHSITSIDCKALVFGKELTSGK